MSSPPAGTRWSWINGTFYSKTNGFQSKTPQPAGYSNGDLSEAWQQINGQAMFADAMAYKLTGNSVYLTDALRWARASISYTTWGKDSSGKQAYDLTAAYELHGMAVLYDWAYSDLASLYPTDFANIQSTLASRTQGMYEAASGTNPTVTTPQWWGVEWEQNHLWICETALAAAALALYGDSGAPSTTTLTTWLQDGLNRWNNTFTYRGTDGADLEGPGYWRYGMEWTLRYFDFAYKILGINVWSDSWMQATGTYRAYFSTASNYWYNTTLATTTDYVDFADADRTDGSSYILRKFASQYSDSTLQWMATQMDTAGGAGYSKIDPSPRDPALYVLWYDDTVSEVSPTTAGYPVNKLFSDLGFEVSRSDWGGNESVIAFQSGPPMGHVVRASSGTFDARSAPHPHPAANNFSVFGDGEWLLRNDGYTGQKSTGQLNSLLVNGSGQLGQQNPLYTWFNMALARYSNANIDTSVSFSSSALDYLVGDATSTYDSSLGLTKFRRRLIYLRPDVLVVLDTITQNNSQPLELRFFPEQQTYSGGSPLYTTTGNTSKLQFGLLSASSSSITSTTVAMKNQSGSPISRLAYSVTPSGGATTNWENAVGLTWSSNTGTPKNVSEVTTDPSNWMFLVTGGAQPEMILINKASEAVSVVVGLPAFPTGLMATTGNAQVALSWTASSGASSYTVERATVSGGPYITIASGITTTSYTDTSVTNGTTYYYVITGDNVIGSSTLSAEVTSTPKFLGEPFAYTAGALSSSDNAGYGFGGGWIPGSASNGRSYTITSGNFSVPSNYTLSVSDGNYLAVHAGTVTTTTYRNLASSIDTNVPATYYVSALIELIAGSGTGDSQIRFVDSGGYSVIGFGGSSTTNKLRINSAYGGIGSVTGSTAGAFVAGTQYLLIGKLVLNSAGTNDVFSFSLFPCSSGVPTTEPTTWGLSASGDLSNVITGIQVYTGANTGTWNVDNLELGPTYASVINY
ncbi:DUF4962 domain-containing protein [Edaphobacter flagellatus]|uniref:DUF4962 domain-containing protein n=1 Tax=Edaphobacter flagellatus TaxID=1933044 RepID=UPI0021B2D0D8|nr:DUF4962 domain-containing protein [Edaphobacter flagellatus]